MKKVYNTFLFNLFLFAVLSAQNEPGSTWNQVQIIGPESKIIKKNIFSGFTIAANLVYPLYAPESRQADRGALQNALYQPDNFSLLFEKLGGEFYFGNSTNTGPLSETLEGRYLAVPLLRLGLGIERRFEVGVSLGRYKTEWAGETPITVFQHAQPTPATYPIVLEAASSGVLADIDGRCFFSKKAVRPYISAGLSLQVPLQSRGIWQLAGVSGTLDLNLPETALTGFGAAGVRAEFRRRWYVEAGGGVGKLPGGTYGMHWKMGAGWRM